MTQLVSHGAEIAETNPSIGTSTGRMNGYIEGVMDFQKPFIEFNKREFPDGLISLETDRAKGGIRLSGERSRIERV